VRWGLKTKNMSNQNKIIAQWMLEEVNTLGRLVQRRAASQIKQRFGEEHVYKNENRNWGINKIILDEFRSLSSDDVVWSRSRQLWRKRRDSDPQNTRMVK